MEEVVSSLALMAGVMALVVPVVAAAVNLSRIYLNRGGDHFVLHVQGKEFIFDIAEIDKEDLGKIERATEAVIESREMAV